MMGDAHQENPSKRAVGREVAAGEKTRMKQKGRGIHLSLKEKNILQPQPREQEKKTIQARDQNGKRRKTKRSTLEESPIRRQGGQEISRVKTEAG